MITELTADSPRHQTITVLGATGSIGVSTLDVIARHPGRFSVYALTAARNVDTLLAQCREFAPKLAVMVDERAARQLAERLAAEGLATEVRAGPQALSEVASAEEVDCVMAAIVGGAGLPATLAAARAGKKILLANKESLVMAGSLFLDAVREGGATLLPIDSEHNAIFQCLPAQMAGGLAGSGVSRIVLTASGGPFRNTALAELAHVTPEQAVKHPNWSMGKKISIDSATMMNKGLEVIEACLLFGAQWHQVEVVIHPQSVIHSMVDYVDGSTLAQLGNPDMRTPIAHALAWPERIESGVARLSLPSIGRLDFDAVDESRFPCLPLAYAALREGGSAPAVLNAANEVAVEAFLQRRLSFLGIPSVIESVLHALPACPVTSLETVFEIDAAARALAREKTQLAS